MLRVSVRKMKTLSVKMETVTLIGKGSENLTCFVYYMYKNNSKIFFLSRCFILWGIILDFDKYIYLGKRILFVGVVLDESCLAFG